MYSYSFLAALFAASASALPASSLSSKVAAADACSDVQVLNVKDFAFNASYIFSTPAHQNSWGYASFRLGNRVLDYKPTCSAASDQLEDFFYGDFIYECDLPKAAGPVDKATFTFDRPNGQLLINQTWQCEDDGIRFTGYGGVKLNLTCNTTTWKNKHWKEGEIYSREDVLCNHVDAQAPIATMAATL